MKAGKKGPHHLRRHDTTTYYVSDPKGNIIAVHEETASELALIEPPIYGSVRIGQRQERIVLSDPEPTDTIDGTINERALGTKRYALKDHLGNVKVVISDLRQGDSAEVLQTSTTILSG